MRRLVDKLIGGKRFVKNRTAKGIELLYFLRFPLALMFVGGLFWAWGSITTKTTNPPITPAQAKEVWVTLHSGVLLVSGKSFQPGGGQKIRLSELMSTPGDFVLEMPEKILVSGKEAQFELVDSGVRLKKGWLNFSLRTTGVRFQVFTPTAVLGVRGTEFSVEVTADGATVVKVTEGKVWGKHLGPNTEEAELLPGQGWRFADLRRENFFFDLSSSTVSTSISTDSSFLIPETKEAFQVGSCASSLSSGSAPLANDSPETVASSLPQIDVASSPVKDLLKPTQQRTIPDSGEGF